MRFGKFLKQVGQAALEALDERQKAEAQQHRAALDEDDGSDVPLSSCDGNKKSLFVGINYFGSRAELRGCINDVKNIKEFVVRNFDFPTDAAHMMVLTDDQEDRYKPTKANMIAGIKWLVQGAKPGDSLFFHYSGHGGTQKDDSGDEADGQDETLIPVDYEQAGVIVDDDLYEMLVANLPQGVRLTAIMDCCHSGSVFDLPFTYAPDGNLEIQEIDNRKAAIDAAIQAGMQLIKGDKAAALMGGVKAIQLFAMPPSASAAEQEAAREHQIKVRSAKADVIQFSGCRDEQTSADANIGGEATGAMSWSFREAYQSGGPNQTYVELLGNIRQLLHGKYTQIPCMSTGHRMNMSSRFTM